MIETPRINASAIAKTDVYLLLDDSGSMSNTDSSTNGLSRKDFMRENVIAFYHALSEFDPDGFPLYAFGSEVKRIQECSEQILNSFFNSPTSGSTNLAAALELLFSDYLDSRKKGQTKKQNLAVIITDGEPDDEAKVAKLIIEFSHQMKYDEEFTLLFLQIGNVESASSYLKSLDDDLTKPKFLQKSAKFDIVDHKTFRDLRGKSIAQVVADAIKD
jgi:uncharacterized protein YegL